MQMVTTIGLDIAKSVFQVHGIDAEGKVMIRRQLKRRYVLAFFQKLPPCLVGIEACATSHYWSRELRRLGSHDLGSAASYVLLMAIQELLRAGDHNGLKIGPQQLLHTFCSLYHKALLLFSVFLYLQRFDVLQPGL